MALAECYFLDVGQGAAQVVLLPPGDAIVVDCGPRGSSSVPLRLLQRYLTGSVVSFVVSHNDADHAGGFSRLFAAFSSRVSNLVILHDRERRRNRIVELCASEKKAGRFRGNVTRLEVRDDAKARILYRDAANDIQLLAIAPDAWTSMAYPNNPNRICGVLALRCGNRRVVFSGDAPTAAWRGIRDRLGAPLCCDVAAVPHHGGKHADAEWLYAEALRPHAGIISVGTDNPRGRHPAPETVKALTDARIRVVCTQMTAKCSDNLESVRPGLVMPRTPSRSTASEDRNRKDRSRNVACSGTVLVTVGTDAVDVSAWESLAKAVDERVGRDRSFHPLCRSIRTA